MLTNKAAQDLLAQIFGGVAYTLPTDVYLALSQTTPTRAVGSGAPWNFTEPGASAELTTALTSGTAYTSLAVSALSQAVASGDSILLTSGANTQTYVTSAAAAVGATALTVTSLAANFRYPVGTTVQDTTTAPGYSRLLVANNTTNFVAAGTQPTEGGYAIDNGAALTMAASTGSWGTNTYMGFFDALGGGNLLSFDELRASSGTISTATGTSPVTALAVTALTIAVASGATVRLLSGSDTQEFTTSAAAAVGATSIAVVSESPVISFPVGAYVLVPNPVTIAASTTPSFAAGSFTNLLS
ncbi:MAG: phage tail fiber protein [Candidatus Dormibacteria bacterium]